MVDIVSMAKGIRSTAALPILLARWLDELLGFCLLITRELEKGVNPGTATDLFRRLELPGRRQRHSCLESFLWEMKNASPVV
jgi:hypothetical protein